MSSGKIQNSGGKAAGASAGTPAGTSAAKRIARFPKKSPCVDVLAACLWRDGSDEAALKWVPKPDDHPPSLQWVGGAGEDDELRGRTVLLRYFGRLAGLYPLDAPQASGLVDQWVAVAAESFQGGDAAAVTALCDDLNRHLALRTYLVAYTPSIADLAVWASLRLAPEFLARLHRENAARRPHLARWFRHVAALPAVAAVEAKYLAPVKGFALVTDAPDAAAAEAAAAVPKGPVVREKQASKAYYMQLHNAEEGKVVTRFPPEPSGFLHLGHIKAALLNSSYADQYKGKMLLRFDDTNPSKESVEFVDAITRDLSIIEARFEPKITYTSDYFDMMMQRAEEMIRAGDAYCDNTPNEEMKKMRMELKPSPFREQTLEQNLAMWEQIKAGSDEGKRAVVRAKIDVKLWVNSTMRDPVMYRCVDAPHHRTGTKYKAYPTYDFACPIVDSIEGVSHALRTNEYHQRNDQYYWFIERMKLRPVIIEDYSRLNFAYTLLSKRKLQWFVDTKRVDGWDSPAFPTVQGVFRRGLTLPALRKFILAQGASKNVNNQDWDKLWAINKQMIDSVVPRFSVVKDETKVRLTLTNGPSAVEYVTAPRHSKNPELGTRVIARSRNLWIEGEDAALLRSDTEFTLIHWGVVHLTAIHREGDTIVSLEGELRPDEDPRVPELKITWISADVDNNFVVRAEEYDYLITKSKLDEDDKLEDFVNPGICLATPMVADASLALAQKGDRMQFERIGYFIVDKAYNPDTKEMTVIRIEDGKDSGPSHLSSKLYNQRAIWRAREIAMSKMK